MFNKIKKDIKPPEYILPENVPLGEVKFIYDEKFIYNGYVYRYCYNAISNLGTYFGFNNGRNAYIREERV